MAGLAAGARLGAYTAAMFAVVGLSEVLQAEMAPHEVGVSVLCPGLVRTRLGETTQRAGIEPIFSPKSETAAGMDPAIVGEMVVSAIIAIHLYIVTHGEHRALVERRMHRLLRAFDDAPTSIAELPQ